MIRLSAYLILLIMAGMLTRSAVDWAWVASYAPARLAGNIPTIPLGVGEVSGSSDIKPVELKVPPLTAFPQISSRPVFFEGRHYPSREVPKTAALSPNAPPPMVSVKELKLLGVRIGDGATRALIAIGAQPPKWVDVGEIIMAWTVKSVEANNVLLEREGQTAALKLYGS